MYQDNQDNHSLVRMMRSKMALMLDDYRDMIDKVPKGCPSVQENQERTISAMACASPATASM